MNPDVTFRAQFLRIAVIAALSASTLAPSVASAANKYWIGGSDWWDVGTNWNPAGQPLNGDYVYLTQSDSTNRTVSYANTLYPSAKFNGLTIDATGTGTITLDQTKDPLNSYYEFVGYSGTGTHIQSGGTNSAGYFFLGYNSGSNGTYSLSGTGTLTVTSEYIGNYGAGSFTQNGGTHKVGSGVIYTDLTLGANSGSSGLYTLISGSLAARNEYLGYYGTGNFNQSGGSNTVNGALTLGYGVGSSGTYILSGTGNLTAVAETIGVGGASSFTQNGGTNTVSNRLLLGWGGSANSSGTYSLNAGNLTATTETIGYNDTGTFNHNGGTNTVSNDLYLSDGQGNGTYNLNGGTLTVGGNITNTVYSSGTSTFNISGGTVTVGGGNGNINVGNLVLGATAGSNINYTLSSTGLYQGANKVAGTLTTGNLVIGKDGTGTFTQTSGTNMTTGTVTLAANAGSSGAYNLDGGTLQAANITVNSGGTFNFNGGTLSVGQFTGNLSNLGGTLAPGSSPGTTDITGDYSQSNAGTFAVEIGGTGPGQFDALHVSGSATLDGTLSVSLFDLGSGLFTPHAGDSFDILTADILNGQFSSLSLAALGDGLSWNISYLTDAIGTTDIVRLTAVPLPAASWLFGSGLIWLIGPATKRARKRLA